MKLMRRLVLRMLLTLPYIGALMFAPAGSFRFWQGWAFLAMYLLFSLIFVVYFYRRDPRVIERRMETKESRPEQKLFQRLWMVLWTVILVLPGFDYRFGWSERMFGGVPAWLEVLSWFSLCFGGWVFFYVLHYNSFGSAVIKVEAGQKVITDGPYRLVRHPMYTGFSLMIVATPFALGSYFAIPPALLLIPVLVYRLRDEERVLHKELPGYGDYCERTRYRLIPSLY